MKKKTFSIILLACLLICSCEKENKKINDLQVSKLAKNKIVIFDTNIISLVYNKDVKWENLKNGLTRGVDCFGKKVIVDGVEYDRVWGTHPDSNLIGRVFVELNKKYSRFQSAVFIDNKNAVSAIYIIGDGKYLFNGGKLTGKSAPFSIDIDVNNIKQLELIIDPYGKWSAGDNVIWVDPKLIK